MGEFCSGYFRSYPLRRLEMESRSMYFVRLDKSTVHAILTACKCSLHLLLARYSSLRCASLMSVKSS